MCSTLTRYIALTWSHPGDEQTGNYSCVANGITDAGHNVVFTKSIIIDKSSTSIDDLVSFVSYIDGQKDRLIDRRIYKHTEVRIN